MAEGSIAFIIRRQQQKSWKEARFWKKSTTVSGSIVLCRMTVAMVGRVEGS